MKVTDGVGSGVGVIVGVGVGVGEGVGLTDVSGEGDTEGLGDELGITGLTGAATFTPLLQTNFLPFFTQVKVFPEATCFLPTLLQTAPVFGAAAYE